MYVIVSGATLLPTVYYPKNKDFCNAQGVLIEFSSMYGILWTLFIAVALHYKDYEEKFAGIKFYAILIGLGIISLLLALIPLWLDFYDYGGNYCFIKTDSSNMDRTNALKFGNYYAIIWSTMLAIAVLHCYRYKKLGEITTEDGKKAFKVIRWYPAVLFISYVPLSIVRIAQSFHPNYYNVEENFGAYFIFSSQILRLLGFFNSIVYVLSDGSIQDLEANWDSCWRFFTRCCEKRRLRRNARSDRDDSRVNIQV
jgi:hypothetical protein